MAWHRIGLGSRGVPCTGLGAGGAGKGVPWARRIKASSRAKGYVAPGILMAGGERG